jgi:hypothetical protein
MAISSKISPSAQRTSSSVAADGPQIASSLSADGSAVSLTKPWWMAR